MTMNWLKQKIRNWLAEDDGPPHPVLEVTVDGKITRVVAKRPVGAGILCQMPSDCGGMQSRVILADQAVDRHHFWKVWRHYGGGAVWEDGSPFEPV